MFIAIVTGGGWMTKAAFKFSLKISELSPGKPFLFYYG